ncbi:Na+/H+ antiporter NhaC [Clostridium sp.]|uniref:Na+/H+ antiporter NhaC n=1 Tax=Clostridium sp. TaxID=1506 RepID=UPI002FC85833
MKDNILPKKKNAFILLIILVAILAVGIMNEVDIRVLLLLDLIVTTIFILSSGYKFEVVLDKMKDGVIRAFPALLIFLLIGALIGTFIQSGVVPTLVYYGLNLIGGKFFLPLGLIVCSITSIATGTSWGTCGTVGVALMAIGTGLGIPAPIIAGMVVSGAFFGDKMSPLSDTTNLAAVSAGTDLYKHIKSMMYTTIPSYILSFIGFTLLGIKYTSGSNINTDSVNDITNSIHNIFNINIWMLVPIVVVLVLSIKKVDAIIALTVGVLCGVLFSILFQGNNIVDALNVLNNGYVSNTGIDFVDTLLTRGGIQSMMNTFSLSFIALILGSLLETFGYLEVIIKDVVKKVKSVGGLIALVIGTTFFTNIIMGEIYLAIILNGSIYKKKFEERGLDNSMLSRTLEEGGTLTGALIPWTTAGAFVSGVLGVSAISYAPYALLNLINPILAIIFAFMGIGVIKRKYRD